MAPQLETAPALSTPDSHLFEPALPDPAVKDQPRISAEQLSITYEIVRTVREIRNSRWRRIALQFPDKMLPDAPRVFEALRDSLSKERSADRAGNGSCLEAYEPGSPVGHDEKRILPEAEEEILFILADTSYGACCVDEIAAEHIDADVVVHYGRTCLSPTSRLPVIYVYTTQPLSRPEIIRGFEETFPNRNEKVVLMADVTYSNHTAAIQTALIKSGYSNLFAPSIVHDPSSPLPNRTIPEGVRAGTETLSEYHLFHISDPPTSLLLSMSSRVASFHLFPTDRPPPKQLTSTYFLSSSSMALRRRYALLTSLNTASIFGILINTLSVKNYLDMVEHVKKQIAAAGKKSYTFVVGKVNAAKVANFSEIQGWVVIGCWESSLIESKDFWRPILTPFELGLALKSDQERIWTGEWNSTFDNILQGDGQHSKQPREELPQEDGAAGPGSKSTEDLSNEDDSDSAPPEFDLRTGKYVSNTRPMKKLSQAAARSDVADRPSSRAIARRPKGDVATIGGELSPAAEYLRSQRTWKGLGSDFEIGYEEDGSGQGQGTAIREGRSGIARGYNSERAPNKD
jgi:diphthamide biosynthesis protein 2